LAVSYKIIIPSNPTLTEIYCAQTLQKVFLEIRNEKIYISKRQDLSSTITIYIGNTDRFRIIFGRKEFADEEYMIQSKGHEIFLNGGIPPGLYYSVVSFLEEDLQIFMLEDGKFSSFGKVYNIKVKSRTYKPPFDVRFVAFNELFKKDYCTFNRNTPISYYNYINDSIGGNLLSKQFCGWGHTGFCMIPLEKYYVMQPELFASYPGTAGIMPKQLCYSNDTVYQMIQRYLDDLMIEHPENTIFSITNNDTDGTCECYRCKRVNTSEGSNSGTLVKLINRIVSNNKLKYPNLSYITLSYLDLAYGTKVSKLDSNVRVFISLDTSSWIKPFTKIRDNDEFVKRIKSWKKCTNNLYIWDYVPDFNEYLLIHPNIDVLSDNLKYYKEIGIKGGYLQSYYENGLVEEDLLRSFVLSQLMWNPELGYYKLINDFVKCYYGISSSDILKYYKLLYREGKSFTESVSINFIKATTVQKAMKIRDILNNVSKIKPSTDSAERLDKWRIPLMYSIIKYRNEILTIKEYKYYTEELSRLLRLYKINDYGLLPQDIDRFLNKHIRRANSLKAKSEKSIVGGENILDASNFVLIYDTKVNYGPKIIDDNLTDSGLAILLEDKSQEHLIQFATSNEFAQKYSGKEVKIRIKGQKNIGKENRLFLLVYDNDNKKVSSRLLIPSDQIGAHYSEVNLGRIDFSGNSIIVIYSLPNSELGSVQIDKLVFGSY